MSRRLAHKSFFNIATPNPFVWKALGVVVLLLFSCSPNERPELDELNSLSYSYHYRQLDSVKHYADEVRRRGGVSARDNVAEAENNLAFVEIMRMAYDSAEYHLNLIPELTDNQLELLVCYVQQMRLCQRRSHNREFYDYRERALTAQRRINEERSMLSARQQERLLYAESEMAIVNSTYYYYVGLEQQSIEALVEMPEAVKQDTAQFLNYLYNIGAGGIIIDGTPSDIRQQEFDHLLRCYQIAEQHRYPYFAANALEALAEHLADGESRNQLMEDNAPGLRLINPEGLAPEELPVWLADRALAMFVEYGDVYQIAGAHRTLASCYRALGDYDSALYHLEEALSDTLIYQAPDLVASIREQLSVAYAAVNDKQMSDENRNLYLDLQEETRQDRQLEARADQYDRAVAQLNQLIAAVLAAIVLLVFLLWLFNYLNKRQSGPRPEEGLLEEKREQLALSRLHVEKNERVNLEQRAKISLVNSITPLIDRMVYAIDHLPSASHHDGNPANQQWEKEYVLELTDQINEYNSVLTHWIQLRQGELSLRIESFPLQPLFAIVEHGKMGFTMKGVSLDILPTNVTVKADRILTLFMLNTLADNARKFTPKGGRVTIGAQELDDCIEVSVTDTGIGMSEEQLASLFSMKGLEYQPADHAKAIAADGAKSAGGPAVEESHGFGLLNCKGIIEKYRKLSQIFSVCSLQAESTLGKGSRFFFRLPKGVVRMLLPLLLLLSPQLSGAAEHTPLEQASIYADSAYFCNINGCYERALLFADSCCHFLNQHYLQLRPGGKALMLENGDVEGTAAEIQWYHDSMPTNYEVILDIRNESAVAALALHEWQRYNYNNRIYTLLFKELSADATLPDYCRSMQQSQSDKTVAVILLVLVLIAIIPAYYFLYLRPRLHLRFQAERIEREHVEAVEDDIARAEQELSTLHVSNAVLDNCLSTLKHETMYYPSRIKMLLTQADGGSEDYCSLAELTAYYRELYGLLSEQAMRQVSHTRLHLKPLADGVLGDETLVGYLFEILRKQSGEQKLVKTVEPQGDLYVAIHMAMPYLKLSPVQAQQLFNPSIDTIPYLLCRQIVRDHGEATNRRGCSIHADVEDGKTVVHIVLPAAKKQ